MDARCNQFYNAIFKIKNGKIVRICDDRALSADELFIEIEQISKENSVIICGDGADLFYSKVSQLENIMIAPPHLKYQNAIGVGIWAFYNANETNTLSPEKLLPVYLRLPQAERELKAKNKEK